MFLIIHLYDFPVRTRPARPARWSAEAFDTGTITREFVCVSASNQGILTNPQSITVCKLKRGTFFYTVFFLVAKLWHCTLIVYYIFTINDVRNSDRCFCYVCRNDNFTGVFGSPPKYFKLF